MEASKDALLNHESEYIAEIQNIFSLPSSALHYLKPECAGRLKALVSRKDAPRFVMEDSGDIFAPLLNQNACVVAQDFHARMSDGAWGPIMTYLKLMSEEYPQPGLKRNSTCEQVTALDFLPPQIERQLATHFRDLPDGRKSWAELLPEIRKYNLDISSFPKFTRLDENRFGPQSKMAKLHPVFWNVVLDTWRRELNDQLRKATRAQDTYSSNYGEAIDPRAANTYLVFFSIADEMLAQPLRGFARFLLEPNGIDFARWSTSKFPQSYSFGRRFGQFPNVLLFDQSAQKIWDDSHQDCRELARQSRTLLTHMPTPVSTPEPMTTDHKTGWRTFGALKCATCHSDLISTSHRMRRYIPFDDFQRLKNMLTADPALAREIVRRTSLDPTDDSYMPANKLNMTPTDRDSIRQFIESIPSPP